MIYVISEDSGSGLVFWKTFFGTYFEEYCIINEGLISGNRTLEKQLHTAVKLAKKDDVIFIAFDKVYGIKGFNAGDFVDIAKRLCELKEVSLYVTSYYCFEEVYLSYVELENMNYLNGKNKELSNVAKYIREAIVNDVDYYSYDSDIKKLVIDYSKNASKNKEHFSEAALKMLTRNIKDGYFAINKTRNCGISGCWTKECDDLRQSKVKDMTRMCNNCVYTVKNGSTVQKLDDLRDKSIFRGGEEIIESFAVLI